MSNPAEVTQEASTFPRRAVIGGAAYLALASARAAAATPAPLSVAARSPRYLANAVAASRDGTLILGLPRWTGMEDTPSVVRVGQDGELRPFPGGSWNSWRPGQDGRDSFVQVNGLHIFADDTLWVVDQGTADRKTTLPGAQKVLQLDLASGRLLRTLRFGTDILPEGAQLNDLRLFGNRLVLTDSGLGGIIVHDLDTGRTIRRLSRDSALRMQPGQALRGFGGRVMENASGQRPSVQSDMLEVSPDGQWLYVSTPVGPLRRIAVKALLDDSRDDARLSALIETVAEIPTINGTAMDTLGNIYIGDAEQRRITVLAPGGERLTLIEDARLNCPDAMFINRNRRLLIPAPQVENLPEHHGGQAATKPPYLIFAVPLPDRLEGHPLGNAISGGG
jgi:sugar lactone lactonase YvrE